MRIIITLALLFSLFSCGSYYNKIRKQPVDPKPQTDNLRSDTKLEAQLQIKPEIKTVASNSTLSLIDPNSSLNSDSSSIRYLEKNSGEKLNDNSHSLDLSESPLPQDTLFAEQIVSLADTTARDSKISKLLMIFALIFTFSIIGIILFCIGSVYLSNAKSGLYNTEKGARDLRIAKALQTAWIVIISVVLLLLIVLLALLFI